MTTPNNLPAELTSFVGREPQLAELRRLLRRSRLITLTGPGGAGKTRLALRLAAGVLDRFPDGVWLVELAAVTDPKLVEQSVAAACGVREQRRRPIGEVLQQTLAKRRTLLILDGCEHLVEPCSNLVAGLLQSCPRLSVLVTSREPLGLPGEVTWRTPSLTVPSTGNGARPDLLRQSEAVRLFTERVRLSRPDLERVAESSPAVAQICARLEGIPLAIELAASLARVLTFEDILARLHDRFRLLTGTSRSALPRHQTLRAAVGWSYGLLSEPDRELLMQLSVFVGGFDLAAAEAVAASPSSAPVDMLPALSRLVDKSLVVAEPGAANKTRYSMLDTIREYAYEKLLDHGETDARRRHSLYFHEFCRVGQTELRGRRQVEWLKRFDEEHGNIRLALEWNLVDDPAAAVELTAFMDRYWVIRGHLADSIDWLDRALESGQGSVQARTDALLTRCRMRWMQGDYEAAEREAAVAYELAETLGPCPTLFAAYSLRGVLSSGKGDWDGATRAHESAFQIAWQLRGPWWVGSSLNNLGVIALEVGDLEVARTRMEQALDVFTQVGDRFIGSLCREGLARISMSLGDHQSARHNFLAALMSSAEFEDAVAGAAVLEGIAQLELRTGKPERTLTLAAAANAVRAPTGAELNREWRKLVDDTVAAARAKLPRQAVDAASRLGGGMTFEQAIRYASGSPPEAVHAVNGALPLTAREQEVAALIADGLTNPEIAARLRMAERTADAHVEHIRNKLGLRTRAQIAVWAKESLSAV